MRFAAAIGSGFGRVLAIFGARTAPSAPTLPLPLRSMKRANERTPASAAHQRAPADAFGAPRRHEGAHVRGVSLASAAQRDAPAQMLRQEGEELAHVALIGFDRLAATSAARRRDGRASAPISAATSAAAKGMAGVISRRMAWPSRIWHA